MKKERIDKLLVEAGHAPSRTKAQALVMAGVVLVDEQLIAKPSQEFEAGANIRIKGAIAETKYASRAGLKLEKALGHFEIDVKELNCIDIGSSTGGFTDCLLQHGAARVTCIDSGTNQLAWKLRDDPRVDVHENTNARNLLPSFFDGLFDLAVMDVSFISAAKLFPAVSGLLKEGAKFVVLIKPQFEVGKGEVGKGGIVREPEKHLRVIEEIRHAGEENGFCSLGVIDSPILGAEGNKEFLALFQKKA